MAYKLPKVTQYVKNVGRSVAFVSIDAIKTNAPGINEFLSSNNDILKQIYAGVKDIRGTVRSAEREIRKSKLYAAVETGVKNMIEDIKTGDFYHDRTEEYSLGALGISEEGDDFDYNFKASSEPTKAMADSVSNAIGAAAVSQSTAIATGTDLVIKSGNANTKYTTMHIDRIGAQISASIGTLYTSSKQTNDFLNGPMMAHLENSKRYYEETLSIMKEQHLMTKELLEMQRNVYKKEQREQRESRYEQSFGFGGNLKMGGYLKNVKSNIKDYADYLGLGMLNMDFGENSNPYMLLAAAPVKAALEAVIGAALSKDFKKSIRSFDKGLSTMFSQLISILNDKRKNSYGPWEFIGRIFGIRLEEKTSINTSDFERGATPFDGITRQAIIEVIPGYLARIESALTGNTERHYDNRTGSWKNIRQIKKEFDSERNRAVEYAGYAARTEINDAIRGTNDSRLIESMNNKLSKMFDKIYKDEGLYRPERKNAAKYYGGFTDAEWEIVKTLSHGTVRDFAHNFASAKENLTKRMVEHQKNGGIYRQIFNDAYETTSEGNGKYKTNYNASYGRNNLLTLSKDSEGKNVFYYLREILSTIRAGGRRSRGGIATPNNRPGGSPNTGGGSSSNRSDDESADADPDDPYQEYSNDEIIAQVAKDKQKEASEEAEKKKFGNWIRGKFGQSKVGKQLEKLVGSAGTWLSKPLDYMTKLLNKADEGMFKLMFGHGEYTLRNGDKAESVFQYIMDQVKGSFEKLNKFLDEKLFSPLKKRFHDIFDPLWRDHGKPIVDEMKNMGRKGWEKAKEKGSNAFDRFSNIIRNGGVADHNDVENNNVTESAFGRVVTKRGLTMISPGEVIIPASFDKDEQNRMLFEEKKEKKRIMDAIQFNAKGTVDLKGLRKNLTEIYNDNIGKSHKNIAGGVLGAGAGILAGINPLLGAAAGAGLSILSNSTKLQEIVFGKIVDGERQGGIIPKKIQDMFKKAGPDMTDFGIAGGILGLFTPLGPLGGAAVGAGLGLLKNSQKFKDFIFGKDGEKGLFSKESYEKFKGMVKKGAPNMAIGAVAGVLTGPFGLLGNAAMGAGLGLLSSTDKFHDLIFGKKEDGRQGSLLGAIQRGIIMPAQDRILLILDDLKKFSKKHVLEPLKTFWDPFKQMMKNMVSNTMNFVKDTVDRIFEKTIGIPISDFLQQKIFKPMTKLFFQILKTPINLAKGAIAAPAHLLGWVGNNIRTSQIRKGTAKDMSAAQRQEYMKNHAVRGWLSNKRNAYAEHKYGMSIEDRDSAIAGMSMDELKSLSEQLGTNVKSYTELQRETGKARKAVGNEISAYFNGTDADGNLRYDKVGYGIVRKIARMATDGDFEGAMNRINKSGLSDEEKAELLEKIRPGIERAGRANKSMESGRISEEEMRDLLEKKGFGRKANKRGQRNLQDLLETEIRLREKAEADKKASSEEGTVEEQQVGATENLVSETQNLINKLTETNTVLDALKRAITGEPDPASAPEFIKDANGRWRDAKTGRFVKNPTGGESTAAGDFIRDNITPDGDDKESTEQREKEEAAQDVEEQEVEETKETNSILSKLYHKFFGKDKKEEKEGGFGILSKLGSGLGSLWRFLGIGGKAALAIGGVSLFGHATEWFKTKVWPIMKVGLFGEDGTSGLLGGTITRVKNWFTSGGFQTLISDKIMPSFINGLGYTFENVVGPSVALLIKNLPSIAWGLLKGLFKGFTSLFSKEKMDGQDEKLARAASGLDDNGGVISEFKNMNSRRLNAFSSNMSPAMRSALRNTSNANSIAYSNARLRNNGSSLGSGTRSITNFNINQSKEIEANANKYLKSEIDDPNQTLTTRSGGITGWIPGLLGRRNNSNIVRYDDNGEVLTVYDQMNTHESLASSALKTAGLQLRKGLFRGKSAGKFARSAANMKWAKPSLNIFKAIGGTTKNAIKGGAMAGNAITNAGYNLHNKLLGIDPEIEVAEQANKTLRQKMGEKYRSFISDRMANSKSAFLQDSAEAVGEKGLLKGIKSTIGDKYRSAVSDKLSKSGFKFFRESAEEVGEKGLLKGMASTAGKNFRNSLSEQMAKSGKKFFRESAENVAEKGLVKGLGSTLKSNIKASTLGKKAGALADGAKAAASGLANGVKGFATKAGKGMKDIATKAADSSAVVNGMKELFEKICKSELLEKIVGLAKKYLKILVDPNVVKNAILKVGNAIAEKLCKGAAKTAIKETTEAIANACTLGLGTIAFFVIDFMYGFNNADTLLGVAKGSSYKVHFGHKICCGLTNALINLIPFIGGFIPVGPIIQLFMEEIFPILGYDASGLQKAKEESSKMMDEWNKAHPDEQYDNLEDFNNKDKWGTKVSKWFKGLFKKKEPASKDGGSGKGTIKLASGGGKIHVKDKNYKGTTAFGKISQLDPSISNMSYNGHTIGQAGCGPVAATNLINSIKGNSAMTVDKAATYATAMGYKPSNDGTKQGYMNSILSASGIPNEDIHGTGAIRSNLKQGNPVVLMGKGKTASSPYGNQNPHYITAMGYDRNGNVIVDDPYEKGYRTYKESAVTSGVMSSVAAKKNRKSRSGFGKRFFAKYGMAKNSNVNDIIHQDLGSWSPMTVAEMDDWINSKCKKNSTFIGNGKVFIDAANKTGLDPRYILAHAALESGWGTSKISKDKNNYFGIGAFDSSPYKSAYSFGAGIAAGIIGGASWIRKNYYDASYGQKTLYKMRNNNGVHQYATDPEWHTKIASIMAGCPVPNTEVVYLRDNSSGGSSDDNTGGENTNTISTLTDTLTELNNSMLKKLYGEDAFNAIFGETADSGEESGGNSNSIATGNIGAYINSIGGSNAVECGNGSGTQCVELTNHYIESVFGAKRGHGNGNKYAKNVSDAYPEKFKYYQGSDTTPKAGDILSLYGNQPQYGHAAIVKNVIGDKVNILEQWKDSGTVRESSYELPGTGQRRLLGIARPTSGFGKVDTSNAGLATQALNSASNAPRSNSGLGQVSNNSVDYTTFLQTIVNILMGISDNTALLSKVVEILSANFDINIDPKEVTKASRETKERQLKKILQQSSDGKSISKIINNKDTEYIINAMRAIAAE